MARSRKRSAAKDKTSVDTSAIDGVAAAVDEAMPGERFRLRKRLRSIRQRAKDGKPFDRSLNQVREDVEASVALRRTRRENVPTIHFDEELPVCQRRDEIAAAIRDHQVVVVCGETGSGKSTQLPKICLELGRGVDGLIGHTQPRRIAARSIAARVADELGRPLGRDVGFKVRFTDTTSNATYIKLMTDGILLAETQGDRFLSKYDTIIVDEAHERSLNVDFLLGYLKRLLPKRRDLKVIITSATIDAERFAEFFAEGEECEESEASERGTDFQSVRANAQSPPSSPDPSGTLEAVDSDNDSQDTSAEVADGSNADRARDVDSPTDWKSVPRSGVPILYVSGRTYPVDVFYMPPEGDADDPSDRDILQATCDAVTEVARIDNGDVLVFQPTERDIREAADAIGALDLPGDTPGRKTHVLPLYGRLSVKEQNRVFEPHAHRRIVIATNVAESSVTVPGIRYVVDTGTARISRYAPRSKVQRLPIEPVSKASADQRKGRCGRVGPGTCIRLYSEEDYESRDDYTAPEIQRTNLAAVVLRTLDLGLGRLDEFPFIDPPKPAAVRDGFGTLFELGAIDGMDGSPRTPELTEIGRRLARMPVDPRIGRMILAAEDEGCLAEVLVIAAALEVQDPRERPLEKQSQADKAHEPFTVEGSDFLAYLELWWFYHGLRDKHSWSKVKKACHQNFLSYVRMREWVDVHRQLKETVEGLGLKVGRMQWLEGSRDKGQGSRGKAGKALDPRPSTLGAAIHRSLLTGLLSNIALREERFEYTGAGGTAFHLWPGSCLFESKPKWVVSAELVETTRRYARTVARIDPEWIEPLAGHLLKRTYSEPWWDEEAATAHATERVTLFGLPVVTGRTIKYGRIDPAAASTMFVQHGLVEGQYRSKGEFQAANDALVAELEAEQAKSRSAAFLEGEEAVFTFFDARVPTDVFDGPSFETWRKEAERENARLLYLSRADLVADDTEAVDADAFPNELVLGTTRLPLSYHLEPGSEEDGVTVTVPQQAVGQLPAARLGWLVPGLIEEKVAGLIKSLPKDKRRAFVPAPDTAREVVSKTTFGDGDVLDRVASSLSRIGGCRIARRDFDVERLPRHLRMNVRVVDDVGETIATGRDVEAIQRELGERAAAHLASAADDRWSKSGLSDWTFGELPERVDVASAGTTLAGHPAVVDEGGSVGLKLCDTAESANETNRAGIRRLFALALGGRLRAATQKMNGVDRFPMYAGPLTDLVADRAFFGEDESFPRTEAAYRARVDTATKRLGTAADEVGLVAGQLFPLYAAVRQLFEQQAPEAWRASLEDVRDQLGGMFTKTFLVDVPWPWVVQYPRYLQAIRVRFEKLKSGGVERDKRAMKDLGTYLRRHRESLRDPSRVRNGKSFVSYRWMLEEYRVSLFAQQLGTAVKVSPTRLDEQWARVVG